MEVNFWLENISFHLEILQPEKKLFLKKNRKQIMVFQKYEK